MVCRQCGAPVPPGSAQCPSCSAGLTLPVPFVAPPAPETSGLAIASMILGILALVSSNVLLFPGIMALVLGYVARDQIGRSGGTLRGDELAVVGLITGAVSTVMGAVALALLIMGFGAYCTCAVCGLLLPFVFLLWSLPFAVYAGATT